MFAKFEGLVSVCRNVGPPSRHLRISRTAARVGIKQQKGEGKRGEGRTRRSAEGEEPGTSGLEVERCMPPVDALCEIGGLPPGLGPDMLNRLLPLSFCDPFSVFCALALAVGLLGSPFVLPGAELSRDFGIPSACRNTIGIFHQMSMNRCVIVLGPTKNRSFGIRKGSNRQWRRKAENTAL